MRRLLVVGIVLLLAVTGDALQEQARQRQRLRRTNAITQATLQEPSQSQSLACLCLDVGAPPYACMSPRRGQMLTDSDAFCSSSQKFRFHLDGKISVGYSDEWLGIDQNRQLRSVRSADAQLWEFIPTRGSLCLLNEPDQCVRGSQTSRTPLVLDVYDSANENRFRWRKVLSTDCSLTHCDSTARCVPLQTGSYCDCPGLGFRDQAGMCVDRMNPCERTPPLCHARASCVKLPNANGASFSFQCQCPPGMFGDGFRCEPGNACDAIPRPCDVNAECTSVVVPTATVLSPAEQQVQAQCRCKENYVGDGRVCVELDRCTSGPNPCDLNALCTKTGPGTFTCVCRNGYQGDGKSCTPINNCDGPTSPCDRNAVCQMTQPGQHTCVCKSGFTGDGMTCTEIDACTAQPYPCHMSADCQKTGPGTYRCSCKPGYQGDGVSKCLAIDDCQRSPSPCSPYAVCTSTGPSSHTCACKQGYKGTGDGANGCDVVDDCAANPSPCSEFGTCTSIGPGQHTCACKTGYLGDGVSCVEDDKCAKTPGPCGDNAVCTKTGPGTFACTCAEGYEGDGFKCKEIDPCSGNPNRCPANGACKHTGPNKFECICVPGYELVGGTRCVEVNLCASQRPCDTNAQCTPTGPAQYKCQCNQGYSGDGKTCAEINVCLAGAHTCDLNAMCVKLGLGTFTCKCNQGYVMDAASQRCAETDPCLSSPCGMTAECIWTRGKGYACACQQGYTLTAEKQCKAINRCEERPTPCDVHATCHMTAPAQFSCVCDPGWAGDGITCKPTTGCDAVVRVCADNAECVPFPPNDYRCRCLDGYEGDGKRECHPIDKCRDPDMWCAPHSHCVNTGPAKAVCECDSGFQVQQSSTSPATPATPTTPSSSASTTPAKPPSSGVVNCVAINPCLTTPSPCDTVTRKCVLVEPGVHRCDCAENYDADGFGGCHPVQACHENAALCGPHSRCENTGPGTHRCVCLEGFRPRTYTLVATAAGKAQSQLVECVEINPCEANPSPCNGTGARCYPTGPGTFLCDCTDGWILKEDGRTCVELRKNFGDVFETGHVPTKSEQMLMDEVDEAKQMSTLSEWTARSSERSLAIRALEQKLEHVLDQAKQYELQLEAVDVAGLRRRLADLTVEERRLLEQRERMQAQLERARITEQVEAQRLRRWLARLRTGHAIDEPGTIMPASALPSSSTPPIPSPSVVPPPPTPQPVSTPTVSPPPPPRQLVEADVVNQPNVVQDHSVVFVTSPPPSSSPSAPTAMQSIQSTQLQPQPLPPSRIDPVRDLPVVPQTKPSPSS